MDIPLGKQVDQPTAYRPDILAPVPRAIGRQQGGIDAALFCGWDDWTAYEFCWQDEQGRRHACAVTFRVPASSPNLVESKSVKLYLNSCFMRVFGSEAELVGELADQLSRCTGEQVEVELGSSLPIDTQPGGAWVNLDQYRPFGSELRAPAAAHAEQLFYTDGFRSLCPVTGQPDWASLYVRCDGPELDRAALCHYLYGFAHHSGFHEQCVEQVLVRLLQTGQQRVAVYARFLRRGGIDINPFRSTDKQFGIGVGRLWRQ